MVAIATAPTQTPLTELVATLDAAHLAWTAHIRWLLRWHRALFESGSHNEPDDVSTCGFGDWVGGDQPGFVRRLPEFEGLRETHRRMHEGADALARGTSGDGVVPEVGYEQVMGQLQELADQMRVFQNAVLFVGAESDPLTGLHNLSCSGPVITVERARHVRTGQPCSIAVLDLDDFSAVNANLGRTAGDRVLREVADVIERMTRPYDWAFRVAGDEFLLCLPAARPEQAAAVCERIRTALDRGVPSGAGPRVRLTASFGVATFEGDEPAEDVEARADEALLRCQRLGGDSVEVGRRRGPGG
jgi:diguanylate cyclase